LVLPLRSQQHDLEESNRRLESVNDDLERRVQIQADQLLQVAKPFVSDDILSGLRALLDRVD